MIEILIGGLTSLLLLFATFQSLKTYFLARHSRLYGSSSQIIFSLILLFLYRLLIELNILVYDNFIFSILFTLTNFTLFKYWRILYRKEVRKLSDFFYIPLALSIGIILVNKFTISNIGWLDQVYNYNLLNFILLIICILRFVKGMNLSSSPGSSFSIIIYMAIFFVLIGLMISSQLMSLVFILMGSLMTSFLAKFYWDAYKQSSYF